MTRAGGLEASLGNWLANLGSTDAALDLLATAEGLLAEPGPCRAPPRTLWHRYLNETRRPVFLQALPDVRGSESVGRDHLLDHPGHPVRLGEPPRAASPGAPGADPLSGDGGVGSSPLVLPEHPAEASDHRGALLVHPSGAPPGSHHLRKLAGRRLLRPGLPDLRYPGHSPESRTSTPRPSPGSSTNSGSTRWLWRRRNSGIGLEAARPGHRHPFTSSCLDPDADTPGPGSPGWGRPWPSSAGPRSMRFSENGPDGTSRDWPP